MTLTDKALLLQVGRPLTEKEEKVVEAFVATGRVDRATVEANIRSQHTGWAEQIADMDEADIKAESGVSSNSFCYRRIGG